MHGVVETDLIMCEFGVCKRSARSRKGASSGITIREDSLLETEVHPETHVPIERLQTSSLAYITSLDRAHSYSDSFSRDLGREDELIQNRRLCPLLPRRLVLLLEQHSKNLNGRLHAQVARALPSAKALNANARLLAQSVMLSQLMGG